MEIIDPIIKFFGTLKTKSNEEVNDLEIKIEYLNVSENEWKVLIPSFQVLEGAYLSELAITGADAGDEVLGPLVRGLEFGILPTTRVSLISRDADMPAKVIAQGGILKFYIREERNLIDIDFGSNWWLDPVSIKRTALEGLVGTDYEQVSLIKPLESNELFPALQAALNQTENLNSYIVGEHSVLVQRIGEEDTESEEIILALTEELEIQTNLVVALNIELDEERERVGVLEETITTQSEDIVRLEEEKFDILNREATPASEVYAAIVSELETASESATEGRFAVSNLSLSLKTHIKNDEDGFKLQLIDSARADYVTDGTISEVQLDIISKDPIINAPTVLIMPKVNGLTETATRKRLTAFGLKLNPIYQASTTMTIGQAFKQTPDAGEEVNAGDTITVIFAKNNENFN